MVILSAAKYLVVESSFAFGGFRMTKIAASLRNCPRTVILNLPARRFALAGGFQNLKP
ncbi:MAG: hypothetical protein KKG06_06920 [Bacteroidetes bacterium]|nr:hypothetical protein [Bacteroidota bacterium]